MQAGAARVFQPNNLEEKIKTYFYNELVSRVLLLGDYSTDDLDEKLLHCVAQIIRATIQASTNNEATILPDDQGHAVIRINNANCPAKYKTFHSAMDQLKLQQAPTAESAIYNLARQLTQLESFRDINPKDWLLSMINPAPQPAATHYDENGVTPELIRTSFYNEMLMQALLACEQGWMTREDLDEEDPDIYINLPALTIMQAIQESQRCANGIRLLNGKAVNADNCPQQENFTLLVATILDAKQRISELSDQQTLAVKHLLATDAPLPENLTALQTSELMQVVGIVKGMSIEISRRRVFLEMVNQVRETALSIIPEPQQSAQIRIHN